MFDVGCSEFLSEKPIFSRNLAPNLGQYIGERPQMTFNHKTAGRLKQQEEIT